MRKLWQLPYSLKPYYFKEPSMTILIRGGTVVNADRRSAPMC
jgi:hypothetical protein